MLLSVHALGATAVNVRSHGQTLRVLGAVVAHAPEPVPQLLRILVLQLSLRRTRREVVQRVVRELGNLLRLWLVSRHDSVAELDALLRQVLHEDAILAHRGRQVLEEGLLMLLHVLDALVVVFRLLEAVNGFSLTQITDTHQILGKVVELPCLGVLGANILVMNLLVLQGLLE